QSLHKYIGQCGRPSSTRCRPSQKSTHHRVSEPFQPSFILTILAHETLHFPIKGGFEFQWSLIARQLNLQPRRMQTEAFETFLAKILVHLINTILAVARDWKTCKLSMYPDLVGPPGNRLNLNPGKAVKALNHPKIGERALSTGIHLYDPLPGLELILSQGGFDPLFLGGPKAHHKRPVDLFHLALTKILMQGPQRAAFFSNQDHS